MKKNREEQKQKEYKYKTLKIFKKNFIMEIFKKNKKYIKKYKMKSKIYNDRNKKKK